MRTYISDAVAFLYFLLDKLPPKPNEAFAQAERGEAALYLPTMAAAELYYLFERESWQELWNRLTDEVSRMAMFQFYPFDEQVLGLFRKTKAKEIHDKIIISTTNLLKADGLITKDEELRKLGEVRANW